MKKLKEIKKGDQIEVTKRFPYYKDFEGGGLIGVVEGIGVNSILVRMEDDKLYEVQTKEFNLVKQEETVLIAADWKDTGGAFEQISEQLKRMGLYVHWAPTFVGTDTYGIVISKVQHKNAKEAEAVAQGYKNWKEFQQALNS